MKVIGVQRYGGPESLRIIERPMPHPDAGQVRVRVEYAGVNPVDAMVRRGDLAEWFGDAQPPFVPRMDLLGVVDEIGPDVADGPALGDRVIAVVDNFADYGAYSQFVVVPAASTVPQPSGMTPPHASSFLMNALTARVAVNALSELPRGERILVTGAAGAVGSNAVALAARHGYEVTGLASTADNALLTGLGASRTIASVDELWGQCAAVIDTAGVSTTLIDHVQNGGGVVVLQPDVPVFDRDITVTHVNVREHLDDTAALIELAELASAGVLPLRVAAVVPAADAAEAHRGLDTRGTRGRFVLDFTTMNGPKESMP